MRAARLVALALCLAAALGFVARAHAQAPRTPSDTAREARAGGASSGGGSGEVELFDYTVVGGDSCAAIAERFFGNRRRYDIIHAYNPGMGPPPHELAPGTVLRLPRRLSDGERAADATVTGVERRVEARPRPADERWIAAERGLGLFRGGRVATQARSAAELTFRDTSIVELRERTLVIIFGASATTTRTAGMEATLETGALRTPLGALRGDRAEPRSGNALRVVTDAATATLRGGSAVVGVDEGGTSRVSNHSGEAAVRGRAGGPWVTLPPDTGSIVRRGARPTPPRPLPAAPSWLEGPRTFAGVAGEGGSVAASFAPVAGARGYRVELARRSDGGDVAFAVEVPASVTSFEAHRLPAGTYYASVATFDGELLEGRPTSPLALRVEEGRLLAPGEDRATPMPSFAPSDPSEEPSAEVRAVRGALYVAPEGVVCDGAAEVTLTGAPITCATSAGEPVLAPRFVVSEITTDVEGARADSPLALIRGASRRARLEPRLDGALPADLTLVGSDGVRVTIDERGADGFDVTLEVAEDAAEPAELRWASARAPGQVMGVVPLALGAPTPRADRAAEPAPEASPSARSPRLTEAYARSPVVSALALTDLDRRGSTIGLSFAEIAPVARSYGRTERSRLTLAADVSLEGDAIQLGTALPLDVAGQASATWEAGSLDVYAHARWVALRRDPRARESLALAIDLGAWFPTHPDGIEPGDRSGLPLVRLAPSIELAYAIERAFSFRMRQGALLDLDGVGARLWASAYGFDLGVWGPLAIGVELDMTLGAELEASLFALGASPQLSIDLEPLVLGLGMRFGLNRDGQAVFGAASVALSASVAIE